MTGPDLFERVVWLDEEMLALRNSHRVVHVAYSGMDVGFHDPWEPLTDPEEVRFTHRVSRVLIQVTVCVDVTCLEEPIFEKWRYAALVNGSANIVDERCQR